MCETYEVVDENVDVGEGILECSEGRHLGVGRHGQRSRQEAIRANAVRTDGRLLECRDGGRGINRDGQGCGYGRHWNLQGDGFGFDGGRLGFQRFFFGRLGD